MGPNEEPPIHDHPPPAVPGKLLEFIGEARGTIRHLDQDVGRLDEEFRRQREKMALKEDLDRVAEQRQDCRKESREEMKSLWEKIDAIQARLDKLSEKEALSRGKTIGLIAGVGLVATVISIVTSLLLK